MVAARALDEPGASPRYPGYRTLPSKPTIVDHFWEEGFSEVACSTSSDTSCSTSCGRSCLVSVAAIKQTARRPFGNSIGRCRTRRSVWTRY